METVIRLKVSELNLNFIKKLKSFLPANNTELEIKIPASSTLVLALHETQEECNLRIEKAIEDAENGKNLIRFSAKEFDVYMKTLLAK